MLSELSKDMQRLGERVVELGGHLDITQREKELALLEAQSEQPGLWDDTARAQAVMRKLSRVKLDVQPYRELVKRFEDAQVLLEMALAEKDGDQFEAEIEAELKGMLADVEAQEIKALLSGPHDAASAYLELKPGAGGTEACDWAQMLLRMYLRWAQDHGFKAEIVDELPGDVAGISSATVRVDGPNAYGFLKSEHGVHRLVRISPFNANGKRQTSFAAVEVAPQIEDDSEIVIDPDDLEIDTYRASGAGGQHVNKTSSAVRITHRPTGIVVQCQNERSQLQNKEVAMKILAGRLAELKEREEEAKMAAIKGEQRAIEFGSQIRNYTFQPYTLVKDVRTGAESGDIQRVMNGDIDPFVTAYLRWRAGEGRSGDDGTTTDDE
ncbi:MAG: peptide chain release factor 2 [Capsulimonadales bacterium]|nr:peptide chain release factor 2 [Capsulimonadales bacterium]